MSLRDTAPNIFDPSQLPSAAARVSQNTEIPPAINLEKSTQGLADTAHLPGEFPTDDAGNEERPDVAIPPLSSVWSSISKWFKHSIPSTADMFESGVKRIALKILPPPRQLALYEESMSHPIASTFVVCQLICCGVPLLLFVAGTAIFAAVALLVWAILSFLILGPMLLVASAMGLSLWGWGWIFYGLVKWTDKIFLNGMLLKLWHSQVEQYRDELHDQSDQSNSSESVRSQEDVKKEA